MKFLEVAIFDVLHVQTYSVSILSVTATRRPPDRSREGSRPAPSRPEFGTYRLGMPAHPDARRAAFGDFVARALRSARSRGMRVPDIETATGVSKTTFYRWRSGDWTREPAASEVRVFCEGLNIRYAAAAQILGWSDEKPRATEPELLDPEVEAVLRRLRDPAVSSAEKELIRSTLRALGGASRRSGGDRQTG